MQQDSSHTLYGIALRVWSRADEKRAETIRELRKRTESDYYDVPDETYWIPYCLSFLSRYPLYNLLGDYLRGMWIHWNKATNLFHAEEVSRILSFPAPRLNDLVRIDMKDYALCYQFPSSPTGFQNFSMWPLFTCLTIPNIVGVFEAAVSPTRRIIFVSHYPAVLTVAAETIRFCVRVYEWSGLYVPVVHARHAKDLVEEPGPYILGITAECRSLYTAPSDALVVDLDRNYVLTQSPPSVLSPGQRTKMITRLSEALSGDDHRSGVPAHLKSAYGGGKLIPAGRIIVEKGTVESVQDPPWWNQDGVLSIMDHVCDKLVGVSAGAPIFHMTNCLQGRNTGVKAIFGGSVKKPLMTKVSMRHLNEIVRERNQYSRDALEAWQDFINLKGRMDTELSKATKRSNFLENELETWKAQFQKFQAFAEQLNKEVAELRRKIESHKLENRKLSNMIDEQKDLVAQLTSRLSGTEKQRDDALEALVLQQDIAEELERERKRNMDALSALKHTQETIRRQRNEAQGVVLHLRQLINGQAHHMEHIIRHLNSQEILNDQSKDEEPSGVLSNVRNAIGLKSSRLASGVPENAEASPEVESQLLNGTKIAKRPTSTISMSDVADKDLRGKTDAIADIIRNISEQCAAAVEGLQIANHDLTLPEDEDENADGTSTLEDGTEEETGNGETETEQEGETGYLTANGGSRSDSVPPTPELEHRSSTALSMASSAAPPTERGSTTYNAHANNNLKIVEDGEEESAHERRGQDGETVTKNDVRATTRQHPVMVAE